MLRYETNTPLCREQREPININAIIDGILHRLEPLVKKTNATVTHEALPDVQADPVRLLQVFQNLMVNAINYSGDAPPHIEISAESSDSEHRFAVSDERDLHCARTFRAHI